MSHYQVLSPNAFSFSVRNNIKSCSNATRKGLKGKLNNLLSSKYAITETKLTDLHIGKIGIDAQCKIARKSPWSRCPCYKRCIILITHDWKRDKYFRIRYILCQQHGISEVDTIATTQNRVLFGKKNSKHQLQMKNKNELKSTYALEPLQKFPHLTSLKPNMHKLILADNRNSIHFPFSLFT